MLIFFARARQPWKKKSKNIFDKYGKGKEKNNLLLLLSDLY